MKISLYSDLHEEFFRYKGHLPETDCDIIVLAGDIGNGLYGVEWVCRESERLVKPIIYVFGNHEFYGERLCLYDQARAYAKDTQVIISEKDVNVLVDRETGRVFNLVSCTLWTDYMLYGPVGKFTAMNAAKSFMSDHMHIRNNDGSIFMPDDALSLYNESIYWLQEQLRNYKDVIVVTHHAPLANFIGPQYRGDMLSPAFASDLEELIWETQPLLWLSGHTHFNQDLMIGNTRVLSNQKGYKNEGVQDFNPNLVIEL